ncbi:MAG: hypothetical protein BGO09_12670 [Bacteroidetes bacterium 47-18]|nr:MAG: hypothetical protein BGO09_12670 [Bacteroidetes bacterium 47-18]
MPEPTKNIIISRLVKTVAAFVVIFGLEKLIKHWEWARIGYMNLVYYPIQRLRVFLFSELPFSVGDLMYIMLLLTSIIAISRLCRSALFSVRFRDFTYLARELVRVLRWSVVIYAVFVFSWGMNYTRQPLLYDLYKNYIVYDEAAGRKRVVYNWNGEELINVLDTLQQQLLTTLHHIHDRDAFDEQEINQQAYRYFQRILGGSTIISPLKKSSLGRYLQELGIQGYFVPFSGEVHYSGDLFYIFRPFVFMHEMAHQKGIASETDANFVAYVLCAASDNEIFRLSARFDLFLYVLGDLKRVDSAAFKDYSGHKIANEIREVMDEMEAHRRRYRSPLRNYSMGFYDSYLRFFGQNEGLKSYNMMTYKVMLYYKNNLGIEDILEY